MSGIARALVVVGSGVFLVGQAAPASADSVKPFDERECFCRSGAITDLAAGHFVFDAELGYAVFVVDEGLTASADGEVHAPGDTILTGMTAAGSGTFLGFVPEGDSLPCFSPLSGDDLDVATLTHVACGHFTDWQGRTVPEGCHQRVRLRRVVSFAEALLDGADCYAAASNIGVHPPESAGCAGGSAAGRGVVVVSSLGLLALGTWRRRRAAARGAVGRRARVCARALGTRALVVSGVVGGLIGWSAQAHAKVLPPFDGRDCFCHLTTLIDLATGHFELDAEGAVIFVVDVGLTAGSDGSVRAADDVIEVSGLEAAGSGAFLSYTTNGRTHACITAQSDPDPEVATVRELMCGASAQGCTDDVPLRDVVRFAEARADGAECFAAATAILGVTGPASDDGCAGGRPGLWIGALGVVALGLWRRRRAVIRGALALVGLVAAGAATTTDARACSLEQAPLPGMSPPTGETIGPLPLLVSRVGFPGQLERDGSPGLSIAVVRDERLGTFLVQGQLAEAWRPAEPLAAGAYTWLSATGTGDATFFVDPELATPAPSSRVMALRVLLAEPAEANGCDGSASSCDDIDFTRLDVTFVPVAGEVATLHLLELAPQGREVHRELVRSDSEGIGVWDEHAGLPSFKRLGYCVAVTPISDDGVVGTRVDLGCFRPDDDDPRVTDERGGCAGGGAALDPMLWIAALLVARRRARG